MNETIDLNSIRAFTTVAEARSFTRAAERMERTVTVPMSSQIETDDMLFARKATLLGAGICALPDFVVSQDVQDGLLVPVLPRWHAKSGHLYMLWPGGRHVPQKTRAFHAAVVAAFNADH